MVAHSRQEGHKLMCTLIYKSHTMVRACSQDTTEKEGSGCPDFIQHIRLHL